MVRIVLDTNIWLDWLLFDDPAVTPTQQAVTEQSVQIVINSACLRELDRVLRYHKFCSNSMSCTAYRKWILSCAACYQGAGAAARMALPRCADSED